MTSKLLFETPGWTINSRKDKRIKVSPENQNRKKRKQNETPSKKVSEQETKHEAKQLHEKKNPLAQNLSNSKLVGSRFRILNETLYTSTGPEALELFQSSINHSSSSSSSALNSSQPINQDFEIYHAGFNQQMKNWPQNPVNIIANQLLLQRQENEATISNKKRINQNVLVADLGCGQATLAKSLSKSNKAFKVFSFDLVADLEGWVTVSECSTRVPLPGSIDDQIENSLMDVVVCCLSLMSTDWVGIILEARRILKLDGELRIAEVVSRFIDVDQFVKLITSIGFSNPHIDKSNTHFILFEFKKKSFSNQITHQFYSSSKQDLIQLGGKHLKPCIYKRR